MPINYHLSLEALSIEFETAAGSFWTGKMLNASWQPHNPDITGWQEGDQLTISCAFSIGSDNEEGLPNASQYCGLYVGACNGDDPKEIALLKAKVLKISTNEEAEERNGGLLSYFSSEKDEEVCHISVAKTVSSNNVQNAIFFNAQGLTNDFSLHPSSRGTLKNFVYEWTMKYNHQNSIATDGQVEIIFGFGDPHVGSIGRPPVRK